MRLTTKQLIVGGLLVAMSVILSRFASFQPLPTIRLGFGPVPIYMASILLGPVVGGLVGAVADLLGYPLNPYGAVFHPLIFLASVARGVLPALMLYVLKGEWHALTWKKLALAIAVTEVVAGLTLTTLGLSSLWGAPIWALLPQRLISTTILVVAYTAVIYMPAVRLRKIVVLPRTGA